MRRALIPCVLALVVAGSAGAADGAKKARPKVPPPSPSPELRGPLSAAPTTPAAPPPPVDISAAQSLFLPAPIAGAPVGGAPQQCRLSCAQTYYFCLAGEDGESCSANWGQCRSACDAPTLATSY
jgi:hypothetical protein